MNEKLLFEMSAVEFTDWLNKNKWYVTYVSAIMNEKFKKGSVE